jgi:outer membrane biosynthesis protein TonB
MKHLAIVFALAVTASGCMTTRAQTPVERPVLEVPPVPPRVIDPAPPPEVPMPEPVAELPPEKAAPPPKPRPTASRDRDAAKPDTAKPEVPAAETAPPPVQPAPPLRTSATVDAAAADRRIRDSLLRTQTTLNKIDYKQLTKPAQSAYDQAKSSMDGAEAALKAQNFELAKEMADKAEKLAKELQTR